MPKMNRFSLVGLVGPDDRSKVRVIQKDSRIAYIQLADSKKAFLHGLQSFIKDLTSRGLYPSDNALDLMFLSVMVSAADLRISRKTHSQDTWTREIDIYLPVKDVSLWQSLKKNLERTLHFLSGDIWRLFFRKRSIDLIEVKSLTLPANDCICLFSGGLDSFVGAIDLLSQSKGPLLVSAYGDNSTSSQTDCVKALAKKSSFIELSHVRANIHFTHSTIPGAEGENTQRARSFLFFSLATLAASGFKKKIEIFVPENGLISLNIPLDPLRVGAWSTRTTHPFYMARWNELVHALGISTEFINPYRFKTKGEMLTGCQDKKLLRDNIDITLSCSSVSKGRWQKIGKGHCGYCLPCLIRRASIQAAFPDDDPTDYKIISDLDGVTLSSERAEGEHIRSFQYMVSRLQKNPSIEKLLVYKSGPLSDYSASEISDYADVFRRGIKEVQEIIKNTTVRP